MDDTFYIYEFLCPECGKIPEILNVHTDNSKIEFNCKKCGIYEIIIDEYYDKLSKNNYYKKCSKCQNKGIYNNKFYYCYNCKDYYCDICKKEHNSNNSDHKCEEEKDKDHYFFNKCCKCKNQKIKINKYYYCLECKNDICEECIRKFPEKTHPCINENEKKNTCLEHNQVFNYFCIDCCENICESCLHPKHKNHQKKNLAVLNNALIDGRNNIKEINNEINNLIEFNEKILKYIQDFKHNKDYLQSIINIGNSLRKGNNRNSKDIKCLLLALHEDLEISNKSYNSLIKDKKIILFRKEKFLHLNKRELDDQDFKKISQIKFNQLKEIDISDNKITNVNPFKKMTLPFLEFLNLSYNQIQYIEPVTKLKSENLQYIFLQNNKIEDMETFLESDFPFLKILRAECYNTNLDYKNDKKKIEEISNKINDKYRERFICKTIEEQINEFKKEYNDISLDATTIDLSDVKTSHGDKMLKKLFLIITYKQTNEIKKLILRNNNINDPSMLSRINFCKLKILDLSVNKIKNLEFLLDMKAENLKYLFLDNNNIEEIYHILKANFPNLEAISLYNNKFKFNEMKSSPIYKKLEEKKVENKDSDKDGTIIKIQLDDKKDTDGLKVDKNGIIIESKQK